MPWPGGAVEQPTNREVFNMCDYSLHNVRWRSGDKLTIETLTIQIYKPDTLLLVIPELTDQLNYGQARTKPVPQLMDACKAYLQAASLT
jgi:hypothetical protein